MTRNENFVGRVDVLFELEKTSFGGYCTSSSTLKGCRMESKRGKGCARVSGISGTGKAEIVLEPATGVEWFFGLVGRLNILGRTI